MTRAASPLLALAAAFAVLVSGCAGAAPTASSLQSLSASPAEFTTDTGAISGLVTDEQLVPIAHADVQLDRPATATTRTDADGAFTFSNVPPGAHILFASQPGYAGASSHVNVEAGHTASARLILPTISVEVPRHESFIDDGFIQLVLAIGAGFVNLGSQAALGTNKVEARHDAAPGNVQTVATLVWDPSTAISAKWMYLDLVHDASKENRSIGQSPLTKRVSDLDIEKPTPTIFRFMVSSPCVPTRPTPECANEFPSRLIQVVYEQRVKLYSTFFYIEPGPADYTAAPDK